MDPISLENLFKILPDGFVLKNLIEVYTMFENILLCKFLEAVMHTLKKLKDRVMVMTIKNIMIEVWI
jgi:hypothetical protein